MNYTGERAIPWNQKTSRSVMVPHIMRYAWACQFAWGKTVVDLACGTGYGSYLLSWVAKHVTGVDIDAPSIEYARGKFKADNLAYQEGDITRAELRFSTDLFVAFECLEHLDDPGALVNGLSYPLVWSIPVNVPSAYHKHVYSVDDIHELMTGSEFWYQAEEGHIGCEPVDFYPAYILGLRP